MNSRSYSHSLSRFLYSRNPFCAPVYLTANTGGNEPGGSNNNPPAEPPAATPPAGKSVEQIVEETISRLLGKNNNDPHEAMNTLVRQNFALEQRALTAEGNQPSKADRELLTKFKALNVPIDEVQKKLGEHDQWSVERANNAKLEGLKKAATAAGLNPDLLGSLSGALDVEYSVIGTGETAKAMVKVKNGDTVSDKELSAYVTEKWPGLVETLQAAPVAPGAQQKIVTPTHRAAPAGSGKQPSLAEKIRSEESANKGGLFATPVVADGDNKQQPAVPTTLAGRMGRNR